MNQFFWRSLLLLVLLIGALSLGPTVYSQSSNGFKHYGIEDGLPSVRVYRMLQDREGFLWFATDAGVSRFDGKEFENFTTEDGLGDNDIISLVQDYWGRIWFLSYNGRLSYYFKGQIHNQTTDNWLKGIENRSLLLTSFEDKSHNLWLGTSNQGVIKIWQDSIIHYQSEVDSLPLAASIIFQEENGDIILGCGFCKMRRMIDKGVYIDVISLGLGIDGLVWTSRGQVFGNWWVSYGEKAIGVASYSDVKVFARFENEMLVNRTDWNGKDSIWVHTSNTGSILMRNFGDQWEITRNLLPEENTSASLVDSEGNLWVSTLTNGIFCENSFVRVDKNGDQFGKITNLLPHNNDQIYLSGAKGVFNGKISDLWGDASFEQIMIGEVGKVLFSADSSLLVQKNNVIVTPLIDRIDTLVSYFKYGKIKPIKDVLPFSNERLWVVTAEGVYDCRESEERLIWSPNAWKGISCLSIYYISDNNFYIGSNIGLFHQLPDKLIYLGENIPGLSGQVRQILKGESDELWVLTQGDGLFVLRDDKVVHHYSQSNGLAGDFVNGVRFQEGGKAIVSTNSGVSIIDIPLNRISSIIDEEGVRNRQIYDAIGFSDTLLLATSKGIAVLVNHNNLQRELKVRTAFSRIEINSNIVPIDSVYNLKYFQNNISIFFSFISFKGGGNIIGEMKSNNDPNWKPITSNRLEFISLGPGKYVFSIRGSIKGTNRYSNTATLTFIIHPPFWRTWWFISLEILLALGIIALIVRAYLQSRARRENVARRLTQSRLTALRSQMNPHFIFNSLNSIQNFVANNDHQEAFLYLSRFGKLMRRVLDNSEHDMIPLEEEVDTLELYLQLEQLRSNNGFDFEIKIADELEPEFHEVPPTLIQPMLENAIWHGVMHRETKGKIWLEFSLEKDEVVVCRVRDNGVGREKASQLEASHKKDHKSKGLSITQERVALLNERLKSQMAMEIIDLFDEGGKPSGTEVVLRVPNK